VKFRVDYVANGQSIACVVYENSANGAYSAITFVDGVVTGLEDLRQMPNDPTFQGR
jgi:hypothetical protein